MSIEAMKQAREELTRGLQFGSVTRATAILDKAIKQAEQAQPVARVVSTAPERIWLDLGFDPEFENEVSFGDLFDVTWSHDNATGNGIEYLRSDLAPPPRKPLTDEQIFECENSVPDAAVTDRAWCIHFARAIEAAHGIKEKA